MVGAINRAFSDVFTRGSSAVNHGGGGGGGGFSHADLRKWEQGDDITVALGGLSLGVESLFSAPAPCSALLEGPLRRGQLLRASSLVSCRADISLDVRIPRRRRCGLGPTTDQYQLTLLPLSEKSTGHGSSIAGPGGEGYTSCPCDRSSRDEGHINPCAARDFAPCVGWPRPLSAVKIPPIPADPRHPPPPLDETHCGESLSLSSHGS